MSEPIFVRKHEHIDSMGNSVYCIIRWMREEWVMLFESITWDKQKHDRCWESNRFLKEINHLGMPVNDSHPNIMFDKIVYALNNNTVQEVNHAI